MKRMMVICNPRSGRGLGRKYAKLIARLVESFKKKGIIITLEQTEPVELTAGPNAKTAFNLGRRAVEKRYDYLGIIAGDGTTSETVNGMIASGFPFENFPVLVLIQAGVGNDYAREVGIPSGINWAFGHSGREGALARGKTISVDLGRVEWRGGSQVFVNVFSFGFDARINKSVRNFKQKFRFLARLPLVWYLFGRILYLCVALLELLVGRKFRYPKVMVCVDDQSFFDEVTLVAVAVGSRYGGIFKIAPQAQMSDGLLEVCQIKKMVRSKMLTNIHRLFRGTHTNLPEVVTCTDGKLPQTSFLTIFSSDNLICQADGEVLEMDGECTFSVLPGVLKILVP
jgi:diacylglycerol kinase (ATP)